MKRNKIYKNLLRPTTFIGNVLCFRKLPSSHAACSNVTYFSRSTKNKKYLKKKKLTSTIHFFLFPTLIYTHLTISFRASMVSSIGVSSSCNHTLRVYTNQNLLVWFGLVRFGLVWFGSVRFGLVRFGLVRFGLVWFCLFVNKQITYPSVYLV
jgi:hypothetical protein